MADGTGSAELGQGPVGAGGAARNSAEAGGVDPGNPGAGRGGAGAGEAGHDTPTPAVVLNHPRDGTPRPIATDGGLRALAAGLAAGRGPVALDAERSSGYRYGGRAFLVQLRRDDVGTALIDPVPLPDLSGLAPALAEAEWVLHAANQDLACLAELGIRPRRLFDTEVAGRLAGLPRVGLGPLVEQLLGFHLAKGHGADDWSRRPLPPDWLDYAALDVELLIELRDALAELLQRQGKLEWALQEFAAIVAAPPPAPRPDPWRRTSGIHRISDRRTLAAVRELWLARDELARERDLAPHRVLPDAALIAAATAMPVTAAALAELPVFTGRTQRRQGSVWLSAIARARALPVSALPPAKLPTDGPPPPNRWATKDPAAGARLTAARAAIAELSERISVPVENLISPPLVRQILWRPPDSADLPAALRDGGARQWQIDAVAPVLARALSAAG